MDPREEDPKAGSGDPPDEISWAWRERAATQEVTPTIPEELVEEEMAKTMSQHMAPKSSATSPCSHFLESATNAGLGEVMCSIPTHKIVPSENGKKKFVVYCIQLKCDNMQWSVFRRYREFVTLGKSIKATKTISVPKLPSKSLMSGKKKLTASFRDERARGLEQFLRKLLVEGNLLRFPALDEFLEFSESLYCILAKRFRQLPGRGKDEESDRSSTPESIPGHSKRDIHHKQLLSELAETLEQEVNRLQSAQEDLREKLLSEEATVRFLKQHRSELSVDYAFDDPKEDASVVEKRAEVQKQEQNIQKLQQQKRMLVAEVRTLQEQLDSVATVASQHKSEFGRLLHSVEKEKQRSEERQRQVDDIRRRAEEAASLVISVRKNLCKVADLPGQVADESKGFSDASLPALLAQRFVSESSCSEEESEPSSSKSLEGSLTDSGKRLELTLSKRQDAHSKVVRAIEDLATFAGTDVDLMQHIQYLAQMQLEVASCFFQDSIDKVKSVWLDLQHHPTRDRKDKKTAKKSPPSTPTSGSALVGGGTIVLPRVLQSCAVSSDLRQLRELASGVVKSSPVPAVSRSASATSVTKSSPLLSRRR